MRLGVIITAVLLGSTPLLAQERAQTLADMRQEMSVLYVEVQKLKRELSTTGGVAAGIGGSALQRLDAIEAQLQSLTRKSEQLENRIDRVVRDGSNQLGDLNFRICELEEGCDIANLPELPVMGGGALPQAAPARPMSAPVDSPELAVGEQSDFERARAAYDAGEFRSAADQFAAFAQTYTGGPLSSEAHFMRGEALTQLGETAPAARAYLESFSGAPDGGVAPQALYKLGLSLGNLGQTREACVTLGEVAVLFPGDPAVGQAQSAQQSLGCG